MGEGHHAVLGSYGQGALYDALELNHIPADWLNEAPEVIVSGTRTLASDTYRFATAVLEVFAAH